MHSSHPTLLGIGGAHVDRRGKTEGAFLPGASNPGTMREDVGGGVFNALRTARQRGAVCTLFSVRGGDGAGEAVAAAARAAGIADISGVFLDRATASYTALLDGAGDVVGALADMGIYDAAFARRMRLRSLRDAMAVSDAVLTDANPPAAAIERLLALAGPTPVHAIAISPAKVVRLRPLLGGLACLFCNRQEASALAGDTAGGEPAGLVVALRALGLRSGVVSAGGGALVLFDETDAYRLQPPPLDSVADATGAGDALAGATVAARLSGEPLASAVRHGVAAARLALRSSRSAPVFDARAFEAELALVPHPISIEA